MFTRITIAILFGLASITFPARSPAQETDDRAHEEIVVATIQGSTESPDPVLVKVRELERKGVLTNVVIMESFPLQIEVTGPRSVINELESMSRKRTSGPK
jgi:hypothetical protein